MGRGNSEKRYCARFRLMARYEASCMIMVGRDGQSVEQLTAEDVMADSAMFYEDRHHNARLRALHRELTRC